MKYPLDKICVKSGIFCPSCQRKLDSGIVDYSEVDVMKALMELEDRLKELRRGEYVKSYSLDNTVVVILKGSWEKQELGRIARELANRLGKRVKLVIDTGDKRKLVDQIISPARIIGISTIWLPDGSEQMVIRISRRDQRILRNKDEWENLLSKLVGRAARIVFV